MNARQQRIRDLLRQASTTPDKGEDESIPRLVRRPPRERSLSSRLDALDSLTRMRGGIGRPTRKAVKLLLIEIRTTATTQSNSDVYQEILDRAAEIESRLKTAKIRRDTQQSKRVENQSSLPFNLDDTTPMRNRGFTWQATKRADGTTRLFLIVPNGTQKFETLTEHQYEILQSRDVEAGNGAAGPTSTATTHAE